MTDVIRYEGAASVTVNMSIPVIPDALRVGDLRDLAWQGFKMLVEDVDAPPAGFVVDLEGKNGGYEEAEDAGDGS